MLQGGGARLCTMIHWAPLPLKFPVRMAPLPSAGKWFPSFAVFRKLVLPSHTLFAGHIMVLHDVFLESLFVHGQLLNFFVRGIYLPPRTRCYQLVHCPQFPLCVCPFGGKASSKEFLGSTLGQSSVKDPMSNYRAPDHFDTRLRLFVHLTSWSRCFLTHELNDSRRSYGYKTLNCP